MFEIIRFVFRKIKRTEVSGQRLFSSVLAMQLEICCIGAELCSYGMLVKITAHVPVSREIHIMVPVAPQWPNVVSGSNSQNT
jgi:hypothetical protein